MSRDQKSERRILSIWLPRLTIERWRRTSGAPDEARVALVVEAAHGQLIHAATNAAILAGARPGMRLTDARALDPGLVAAPADPAGDAALLARLARWASRWSPLVEVDGDDGLRLDVSGAAHLFGGEAGLVADVEARFAGLALTTRAASAPPRGGAWARGRFSSPYPGGVLGRLAAGERGEGCGTMGLSHSPHPPTAPLRAPPSPSRGEGLDLLAPLPVAALRLPPGPTRTLERLGLKTIGALAGVPRRSLARRFREADNPIDALDRMLGRKAEPLTATPVDPPPRALLRLAEPVAHPEAAAQALALLVPKLVRELETRRLGARRLALAGYRVDGEVEVAAAECALATREAAHLMRLLAERAERLDPGFGFDGFAL